MWQGSVKQALFCMVPQTLPSIHGNRGCYTSSTVAEARDTTLQLVCFWQFSTTVCNRVVEA